VIAGVSSKRPPSLVPPPAGRTGVERWLDRPGDGTVSPGERGIEVGVRSYCRRPSPLNPWEDDQRRLT
jgi:hypothetical protein